VKTGPTDEWKYLTVGSGNRGCTLSGALSGQFGVQLRQLIDLKIYKQMRGKKAFVLRALISIVPWKQSQFGHDQAVQ
jgi:hypothetical protein